MFQQIGKRLTPPTISDQEQARAASLLSAILLGLAGWMGLGLLINFLVGAANQANIVVGILSIGLILMLRWLGQRGHVKLATLLTSTLIVVLVTIAIYNLGTIRTVLLGYYFIAFIIPTLLIGPGTGLIFASLCIFATLVLMVVEQTGMLPHIAPPTAPNQVIVFGEIVLILFAIPYLARKVMRESLEQANNELKERKRAEEAARQSEEKYRKLIETTDTGFVIVDSSGTVLDANPKYVSLTGHHDLEEILGRQVTEWTAEEEIEHNREALKQCIDQGFIRNFEVSYADSSGTITPIEINATVDQTPAGLQILTLCRDISDRKRDETELKKHRENLEVLVTERAAELKAANEKLEKLSQVKDDFVSNVSHELRTPIASLKVHQHLLKGKPEQLPKYLTAMQRETDRLHRTIEALLQLSRLDQGRVEPQLVPVDLGQFVEQYVQDRVPLASAKNLTLTYGGETNLPQVNADPQLLGEALSVLLTNAINYTPTGGEIRVSTGTRHQEGQTWAGFIVSDNGPGIPEDEREHLFERFFRGSVGRRSGAPGTGLGLALAHEIVDRHNGTIEFLSHEPPEHGATFSVWLTTIHA